MHKIERLGVFMDFTLSLGHLSKCTERQVAAVITNFDLSQVYSIGLNGGPKGLEECLCKTDGKYGCLHAEINALIKCQSDAHQKVMFVGLSPCKQCAAAIINAPGNFAAVYYFEEWKDVTGINILKSAGIHVASLRAPYTSP